ncbi:MAG: hypothetical protein Q7S02_00845, partial [bacterium]|nr:hypothetical protein [bacterium]
AVRALGIPSVLVAQGKSVELLPARHEAFRYYPTPEEVLADIETPAALVTSFCEGESYGRALTSFLKGRCPTMAHLDFWSAPFQLGTPWSRGVHQPDDVLVSDQYGRMCAEVGWRGGSDHIVELGFPALDDVIVIDQAAMRREIREHLGIPMDAFAVLVAGQDEGSAEVLESVAGAITHVRGARSGRPIVLIPREHPRMRKEWGEEAVRWDAACALLGGSPSVVDGSKPDATALIAASDTVISWCSTMLITAAALQRFPIAWQPPVYFARYRALAGGALDEFPLVAMGCGWKAMTKSELVELLTRAYDGDASLRSAQERELRLDGKNAERVAAFVRERIADFRSS